MADEIAVELRIKNQQLANDLRKANQQINVLKKNMLETGNTGAAAFNKISVSANKAAKSVSGLATVLKAVAVYAAGQAILGNLKTWSEYISNIQAANNQLKSLGGTSQDLARIQAATLQIANETGSAYNETAITVARLAHAIEEFGGTTDQALIITDSLNKALLLTGATGSEATSTLVQFSQALQSGILQGDELRSLRENAPAVIRAIADEMGIATSAIKKAGEDGKITADVVAKALIKANKDLSDGVAEIPLTLGRSLTVASNNIADFITNNEGLTKFIEDLSAAIVNASNFILILAEDMLTFRGSSESATEQLGFTITAMDLLAAVISGPIKAFYTLGKAVKLAADIIVNVLGGVLIAAIEFGKGLLNALAASAELIQGIVTFDAAKIAAAFAKGKTAIVDGGKGIVNAFKFVLDESNTDFDEFSTGVADAWLNTARTVEKVKLNPGGDLNTPAKKAGEDTAKAFKSGFDGVFEKMTRDKSGLDALLGDIQATKDAKAAWDELAAGINPATQAQYDYNKSLDDFILKGTLAGLTLEEIKAVFDQVQESIKKANSDIPTFEENMKSLGDAFAEGTATAFIDFIEGTKSAGEAIKDLIRDLAKLVIQMLIVQGIKAGLGMAGVPGFGAAGASSGTFSTGPQVRVYNYAAAPGGIQTRGNSSGGIDVIIGQVAQAVTRGGNPLSNALRQTYGINRVGR